MSIVIQFGKYKKQILSDILKKDKEYCEWIVDSYQTCQKPFTKTVHFKECYDWLRSQKVNGGNHTVYSMMRYITSKPE